MRGTPEKNRSPTKRLGFWIFPFLILSAVNAIAIGSISGTAMAIGQIVLLVGLFAVLLFLPSDARERARLIDTEAATATLGITFWAAWTWSTIAEGFDLNQKIYPGLVALFILGTYVLARIVVGLRHR